MQVSSIPMTEAERAKWERIAKQICGNCGKPIGHRKSKTQNRKRVHRTCPIYVTDGNGRMRPEIE
jgi:hypothetical protein